MANGGACCERISLLSSPPSYNLHSPPSPPSPLPSLSSPLTVFAQSSDNLTVTVRSVSSPYYFIGTQFTINAVVNADQLRIIRWEHGPNSEEVMVSEGYTISTAADGSNSRLTIASPVASDAGVYTVVAVDGWNREIRKESAEIELLCKFVSSNS